MTNVEAKPPYGVDYRGIVLQLAGLTGLLAVVGGLVGYLVQDWAGLWGGLMGALVTGLFFATSALMMYLGRRGGPQTQIRNLVISWFAKIFILFGAFVAIEQASWLDRKSFGFTVLAGVLGSLIIEGRAVLKARIGLDSPPLP